VQLRERGSGAQAMHNRRSFVLLPAQIQLQALRCGIDDHSGMAAARVYGRNDVWLAHRTVCSQQFNSESETVSSSGLTSRSRLNVLRVQPTRPVRSTRIDFWQCWS
jgi:hypothetical protein